jgi:hypothetical protein
LSDELMAEIEQVHNQYPDPAPWLKAGVI